MKTVKLSAWNKGSIALAALLISTSLAGAPLPGTLTYTPLSTNSIPTLGGSMLLLLSLLLMLVAFRVAKNKNTSKLLVTFLGVTAITLGSSGLKIVTDVNAVVTGLVSPDGGIADIFGLQLNDYQNTSGVTLRVTDVDIGGISCDRYQGGSISSECALVRY